MFRAFNYATIFVVLSVFLVPWTSAADPIRQGFCYCKLRVCSVIAGYGHVSGIMSGI